MKKIISILAFAIIFTASCKNEPKVTSITESEISTRCISYKYQYNTLDDDVFGHIKKKSFELICNNGTNEFVIYSNSDSEIDLLGVVSYEDILRCNYNEVTPRDVNI